MPGDLHSLSPAPLCLVWLPAKPGWIYRPFEREQSDADIRRIGMNDRS